MASWSRIVGSAILLVLATVVFGGVRADADNRAVSVTTARDVLAREFGLTGTVDCGLRSGLRCEIDSPFLLTIWTEDISGSRERVEVDISWIVQQLDGYDQDDLICLNVQATTDGRLQAVGLSTPCGQAEPTKRPPDEKERKTADEATPTPLPTQTRTPTLTFTPVPSQTPSPTATVTPTSTVTPTATVTPTSTPTPIINLSLTKSGILGTCNDGPCSTVWTITVTNSGPNIAHNVVVIDRPLAGLTTVDSAVVSQGTFNTATNRWTIGTIGVGAGNQQTATITFAESNENPLTGGWTNQAEVESVTETDSNSTPNNSNPAEDDQSTDFVQAPD